MGAWSSHPMGNDTAMDLVCDFFDCKDYDKISTLLGDALESGRTEEAVAAATIIAACKARMPKEWMEQNSIHSYEGSHDNGLDLRRFNPEAFLTADLVNEAAEIIAAIRDQKAGADGWVNPEDGKVWLRNLAQIAAALEGTSTSLRFEGEGGGESN